MASEIRVADTQHWDGKALPTWNGQWLKRSLGAAQRQDRSTTADQQQKEDNENQNCTHGKFLSSWLILAG